MSETTSRLERERERERAVEGQVSGSRKRMKRERERERESGSKDNRCGSAERAVRADNHMRLLVGW
jgi:ribosome assembly protein YihI (activator of Der GTPase)